MPALLSGTRAAQPAYGSVSVGQLYRVTDEGFILERATASGWVRQAPGGVDDLETFFTGYVYNFVDTPGLYLLHTPGTVNARAWAFNTTNGATLDLVATNDDFAAQVTPISVNRSGDLAVARNVTVTGGSGPAIQSNYAIGLEIAANYPYMRMRDAIQASGSRLWDVGLNAGRFTLWAADDADSSAVTCLEVDRVGALYERARTVAIGEWTAHAYNSGDYTAAGAMTITVGSGDVACNHYTLIGKTLIWHCQLATFTLGGTGSQFIYVALPGGITTLAQGFSPCGYYNDGASVLPAYVAKYDGSHVSIARTDSANHVLGTDNHYVYFTFIGELS